MLQFKPTKLPRFIKINNNNFVPELIKEINCPSCGLEQIKKSGSKWIGRCTSCGHIHNFLIPIPAQSIILQMRARIFNLYGGTGSGKTTASSYVVAEAMRNNPGVKIMAFAQSLLQLQQTAKDELIKLFFKDEFVTFNESAWVLKNGSKISWYTSDSEQKVRGANIGIAWLIESSGIPHSIFKQLMTRTRQDEMKIFLKDEDGNPIMHYDEKTKRYEAFVLSEKGTLLNESNPTYEWPRDMGLLKSHTVLYTKSVRGIDKVVPFVKPQVDPEEPDRVTDMVTIMFASVDNPMMTSDYLSTIRSTYDSEEEYNRDLYCDMSYTEGLIYGLYANNLFANGDEKLTLTSYKEKWGESFDVGGAAKGNDESAYGLFKVTESSRDGELPDVLLVDGYKIDGLSTQEEAYEINKKRKEYGWRHEDNLISVVDPSGVKNEKKTKSNIIKDLRPYNIYLNKDIVNPDVDHGIKRVLAFMKVGKFKVMPGTEFSRQFEAELARYMWTKNTSRSRTTGKLNQKPIDRDNHIMDMIRFFIVSIPISKTALSSIDGIVEDMDRQMAINSYKADSINYFAQEYDLEDKENEVSGVGGVYLDM